MACRPTGVRLPNPTHPRKDQYTSRRTITTSRSGSRETRQPRRYGHPTKQVHWSRYDKGTSQRRNETSNHDKSTRPPTSRTSGKRRDDTKGKTLPSMEEHESMDRRLRQRMRCLSTEQDSHPPYQDTIISHSNRREHPTVSTYRNGLNHRTTHA